MADDADDAIEPGRDEDPPETAATRGRWRGYALRRAPADAPAGDLAALTLHENHRTLRLAIVAVAVVLATAALIPIANAQPRRRPAPPA